MRKAILAAAFYQWNFLSWVALCMLTCCWVQFLLIVVFSSSPDGTAQTVPAEQGSVGALVVMGKHAPSITAIALLLTVLGGLLPIEVLFSACKNIVKRDRQSSLPKEVASRIYVKLLDYPFAKVILGGFFLGLLLTVTMLALLQVALFSPVFRTIEPASLSLLALFAPLIGLALLTFAVFKLCNVTRKLRAFAYSYGLRETMLLLRSIANNDAISYRDVLYAQLVFNGLLHHVARYDYLPRNPGDKTMLEEILDEVGATERERNTAYPKLSELAETLDTFTLQECARAIESNAGVAVRHIASRNNFALKVAL